MKNHNLTGKQVNFLRGLAHGLSPLVQLGKSGSTTDLVAEIDRCLEDHELIKVRIGADDRADFRSQAAEIAGQTSANLVQVIGRVAVYYRPSKKPVIKLPA